MIEKHVGETPLSAMEAWRAQEGVAPTVPLAYAGRLDPMASGSLLVLIGDECKRQKEYHGFDKEYQFEVLLGASSDTGDVLGIARLDSPAHHHAEKDIRVVVERMHGIHTLSYPKFSAKTVGGVPLHEKTLKGDLVDSDIPTYEARIKKITYRGMRTITSSDLLAQITEKIATIPPVTDPRKALGADFRRGEIIPRWHELLEQRDRNFQILSATAIVSSGTYIRTLSEEIGKQLGTEALAYSIHRSKIGTYLPLASSLGFWTRKIT